MLNVFSTIILLILLYGWFNRHNRSRHIKAMSLAFGCDVLLLLMVEFADQAIEKAVTHLDSNLLVFHIVVSALVLVFYVCLAVLGRQVVQGNMAALNWHRRLSYGFIFCRLANYVTGYWVVTPPLGVA